MGRRYGLLSAEDAVAEKQDSILYQIQTIFGYLLESEKMSYSPEGFCHAYKVRAPVVSHPMDDVCWSERAGGEGGM